MDPKAPEDGITTANRQQADDDVVDTSGRTTLLDYDGASRGYGTAAPGDNADMPAISANVDAVAAELDAAGNRRTAASLRGVINRRNGRLYASRPKKTDGECRYLWRMLAFHLSRKPEHHCMPVTADDGVGPSYERGESAAQCRQRYKARRQRCRELDAVVDRVVDQVPITRQHGALRWARALGA